jgi:hypothetical protein
MLPVFAAFKQIEAPSRLHLNVHKIHVKATN